MQSSVCVCVCAPYLIIPDLHQAIISPRYEVGLVSSAVVINTVDPLLMALQSEVGSPGAQLPHLQQAE